MTANEHIVVDALGIAVGMTTTDPETASRLRHLWSRALTEATSTVQATPLAPTGDAHDHDYATSVQVTVAALQATAGQRLNIHAGAVADPDGRALAVVGSSGTGKTTAILGLAKRLGYLSDETVSVDGDLTVHPHPKPLSVIIDPSQPNKKMSISPDDAGLQRPPAHSTLRRIVLLRRDDTTSGLTAVSAAEAMLEIIPQTSSLVRLSDPLLTLAEVIRRCGGAFALHYTEIDDHLDDLASLLETDLPPAPTPVHHPPQPTADHDPNLWSRAGWVDAVAYDEEVVVMLGEVAHLLSGLGATLWLALAQAASLDALVSEAISAHGAHPDARDLVVEALTSLADNGVVSAPTLTAG